MTRKKARENAMNLVYEWIMGGEGGEETRFGLLEVSPGEPEADYMERLYTGVVAHVGQIDEKLSSFLQGWSIERLSRVDLSILRIAAYEMLLGKEPTAVVVNEAVELANMYSSEKAGRFINGVLGNLGRSLDDGK